MVCQPWHSSKETITFQPCHIIYLWCCRCFRQWLLFTFDTLWVALVILSLECLTGYNIILTQNQNTFFSSTEFLPLSSTGLIIENFGIPGIACFLTLSTCSQKFFSRFSIKWGCSNQALILLKKITLQSKWSLSFSTTFSTNQFFWRAYIALSVASGSLSLNCHLHTKLCILHPLHFSLHTGKGQCSLLQIFIFSKSQCPFHNIALLPKWGHIYMYLKQCSHLYSHVSYLGDIP